MKKEQIEKVVKINELAQELLDDLKNDYMECTGKEIPIIGADINRMVRILINTREIAKRENIQMAGVIN